ncbi:MAG: hypothetical protein LBU60_02610 [Clostridiales bacterium]|jgi:hypothetical protein|nr:hypothetical protein [Clostridiales bacterium]
MNDNIFEEYDNPRFTERGLLVNRILTLDRFARYISFYYSLLVLSLSCISVIVKLVLSIIYNCEFLFFESYIIAFDLVVIVIFTIIVRLNLKTKQLNVSAHYTLTFNLFVKVKRKMNVYCASMYYVSVLNLLTVIFTFGFKLDSILDNSDYVYIVLTFLTCIGILSNFTIIASIVKTYRRLKLI